jgi:hypothetical protein
MKAHRKCDTAKYRRRRIKEKTAHVEHTKRRQESEAMLARQRREEYARYQAAKHEYEYWEQRLVNVLARRLYQVSPEHAAAAAQAAAADAIKSWFRAFAHFAPY